jgi:hypothetical protein
VSLVAESGDSVAVVQPADVRLRLEPGGRGNSLHIGEHDVSNWVDRVDLSWDVVEDADRFPSLTVRFRGVLDVRVAGADVAVDDVTAQALVGLGWDPPQNPRTYGRVPAPGGVLPEPGAEPETYAPVTDAPAFDDPPPPADDAGGARRAHFGRALLLVVVGLASAGAAYAAMAVVGLMWPAVAVVYATFTVILLAALLLVLVIRGYMDWRIYRAETEPLDELSGEE